MDSGNNGIGMGKQRQSGVVDSNRRGLQIRAIEDNKKRQQEQDIKNRKANQQFDSVKDLFKK